MTDTPIPIVTLVTLMPSRVVMASKADFARQLDKLIGKTARTLRIFDFNAAECGFGSAAREEQLAAFLRTSRRNRVFVAVHDLRYLETQAPRVQRLMKLFSHAFFVHQVNEDIRNVEDCLIVADDAHCIRKPHWERFNGVALFDDPVGTRDWLNRFNAVWEQSRPGLSATTIGL